MTVMHRARRVALPFRRTRTTDRVVRFSASGVTHTRKASAAEQRLEWMCERRPVRRERASKVTSRNSWRPTTREKAKVGASDGLHEEIPNCL